MVTHKLKDEWNGVRKELNDFKDRHDKLKGMVKQLTFFSLLIYRFRILVYPGYLDEFVAYKLVGD